VIGSQVAVAQDRRAVAAGRHRFGQQILSPADLRRRQPGLGQDAQVINAVGQIGRLQASSAKSKRPSA